MAQHPPTCAHHMRDSPLLLLLAGGAVGAIAAYAALQLSQRTWHARSHRYAEPERQGSVKRPSNSEIRTRLGSFHEDEVLAEQFTRNVQFFGLEGQLKIANAFVVVIGLGVSSCY